MEGKRLVLAIIQARMRSTRLPGKVLAEVAGRPMLWHVVERVRGARLVDGVLVATSSEAADDPIEVFCRGAEVDCWRGSEADVLDRYYQAAKERGAEVIVRITGDCPLIDGRVVDRVVEGFLTGDVDYVSNTLRYTYPDGLDTEVFSMAALERAWREANRPAEREHVTLFMRTSGLFRVANVENEKDLSHRELRWTVDTPADLEFVRGVYRAFEGRPFGLDDVLELLEKGGVTTELMGKAVCNEGYYRSLAKEPAVPVHPRELKRSREFLERARKVIPSCTQTFSKGPTQFVRGVAPTFLGRAEGSHVWDVDGNEYIDYPMGLGAVILGHNDPEVSEAVRKQVEDGNSYSLPHPLEVEVAELLVEVIPCGEMVRFGKNGSDVTAGAVRAARAYTGREVIACCGYHGWQDWFIGTTTRSKGVPRAVRELTRVFAFNDLEGLRRIFEEKRGEVAAVVMEPVGVVEPAPGFLEEVKEMAQANGALLIFDEIVTGFRLALGGAQEHYGVTPDLSCCGKGMANGYPLAAVTGRREIMEIFDEIFFSFTFGGEAVSLAAAKVVIERIRREGVGQLWEQGRKLRDGYNVLAGEFGVDRYTKCLGLAPRTVMSFRDEKREESLLLKSFFQQECLKRGVLFSGGQNVSFSHSDGDIDWTLRVYRTAMELLAEAIAAGDVRARLEGEMVEAVFRQA